jgi:hypothetical protein
VAASTREKLDANSKPTKPDQTCVIWSGNGKIPATEEWTEPNGQREKQINSLLRAQMEFGENTVQLQTPGRNQRGRDGKNESLGAETVANKPRDRRPKNENKTSNLETTSPH